MELVARKKELMLLHRALEKRESQFIAVYGRRRVGKTYLVREAYEGRFCFTHTGLYGRSRKEHWLHPMALFRIPTQETWILF